MATHYVMKWSFLIYCLLFQVTPYIHSAIDSPKFLSKDLPALVDPDLITKILFVEKTAIEPGGEINVQSITINQGLGNASNAENGIFTRFYLSIDDKYDPDEDFFVGGEDFGATVFEPGAIKVEDETLELTKNGINIGDGDYYLLLVTDPIEEGFPNGYVQETNENNNVDVYESIITVGGVSTNPVLPDLVCRILEVEKTQLDPGETFDAISLTINQGIGPTVIQADALGWSTDFYLSTDLEFNEEEDFFIGGDSFFRDDDFVLLGGEEEERDEELDLNKNGANVPEDLYFLILVTDPPDIDDPEGAVEETNEFNNIYFYDQQITVGNPEENKPDLVGEINFIEKTELDPGEAFNSSATTTNQGTANAINTINDEGFFSRFFLSENETFEDENDFNIGGDQFGPDLIFTPGFSQERDELLELNKDGVIISDGEYFLLFVVDPWKAEFPTGLITESNEDNNVTVFDQKITIGAPGTPDLVGEILTIFPTEVFVGATIDATAKISNIGDGPTVSTNPEGFFINYYLSANTTFNNDEDFFIGGERFFADEPLAAGAEREEPEVLMEPGKEGLEIPPPGCYNLLFVVDPPKADKPIGDISEKDELNNVYVYPEQICLKAQNPDLTIVDPQVNPDNLFPGEQVNVTFTQKNLNLFDADLTTACIYLSSDETLDATDDLLSSLSTGEILGSGEEIFNQDVTIPVNTAPGNYFIIVIADCDNDVVETNEDNNDASIAITVNQPLPDLVIIDPIADPNDEFPGAISNLSFTLQNNGNGNAGASKVCFYLSINNIIEGTELPIGEIDAPVIMPNSTQALDAQITIPPATTPGSYFIIFKADCEEEVAESDETNNLVSVTFTVNQPLADFTVSPPTIDPTEVFPGENTNINITLVNEGQGAAGASTLCIYLSTNNTFEESGDILLKELNAAAITSGDEIDFLNEPLALPASTQAGAYFILVVADCQEEVNETNEDNNIGSVPITINQPLPNLFIANPTLDPTSLQAGNETLISFDLINGGNANASSSTLCFFLSEDGVLDQTDESLGEIAADAIATSGQIPFSQNLSIPENTPPGDYVIFIQADCGEVIVENDETDNLNSVNVTIEQPLPDLSISNPSLVPNAISAGDPIQVNFTLNNEGLGNAVASTICLYLSTNPTFEAGEDDLLGEVDTPALGTNLSNDLNSNVNIDVTTIPGDYFIILIADCLENINESNEGNNSSSVPFTVDQPQPDLTVNNITTPVTSVFPGDDLPFTYDISNIGDGAAGESEVCFYLSEDNNLDPLADFLLNEITTNALAVGDVVTENTSINIEANINPGTYFIFLFADCKDVLAESNEENNTNSFQITVEQPQPDLVVQNPNLDPTSVFSGSNVNSSFVVANIGAGTAGPSTVCVYLSENNTLELAADQKLGEINTSEVPSGGNEALGSPITIPENTLSGTYFILFAADCNEEINESDEGNNVASSSLIVTVPEPDLTIESILLQPDSVGVGDEVQVDVGVANIGLGNSGVSDVCIYISANSTFEPLQDILLSDVTVETINGESSIQIQETITIPQSADDGIFFILVVADCENTVAEGNENNNISSAPIKVGNIPSGMVDLTINDPQVDPNDPEVGDIINISYQLTNIGDSVAGSSTTCLYLSTDNDLSPATDILLASEEINNVEPLQSLAFVNNQIIPQGTESGTYFILIVADCNEEINEGDEINNIASVAISVGEPLSDLIFSDMTTFPGTVEAGQVINVEAQLENAGTTTANASTSCFFLSTDNTLEASQDVILASIITDSLTAGGTLTITEQLQIPANTVSGDYFILSVADCLREVPEANENNNVRAVPISIIGDDPADLTIQIAVLDNNTVPPGSAITSSTTIANIDLGEVTASTLCIYLSEDTSLSLGEDAKIGEEVVPPLTGEEDITIESELLIAGSVVAGEYFILFVADCEEDVVESNEDNNIRSARLTVTQISDTADLIITNHSTSKQDLTPNESFTGTFDVSNIDTTSSAAPSISCVYLSKDALYNPTDDIKLGEASVPILAVEENTTIQMNLQIPNPVDSGEHFILFIADCENDISEINENNNISRSIISIIDTQDVIGRPNLEVTGRDIPKDRVKPGNLLNTRVLISNKGTTSADDFSVCVYLSNDQFYNSTDILLGKETVDSLGAGKEIEVPMEFDLPNDLDSGDFFIFVADCDGNIDDPDRSDNEDAVFIDPNDVLGCDDFLFPNVLTPNNDGENDSWIINSLPFDNSLQIFDRWGSEIFQANPYENNWVGQRTASTLTARRGTYYYVLQINSEMCRGSITLVR